MEITTDMLIHNNIHSVLVPHHIHKPITSELRHTYINLTISGLVTGKFKQQVMNSHCNIAIC